MSESVLDSEFVDEAVASFGATAHFGDPSGEQWALEGGRALVRRPDLAVIAVSGADRLTWLTSLASQIVTGLVPGMSRELLILSPEGRVEHWAGASDDGEALHLIVERADLSGFVAFLDSMRFALRVAVAERDVAVFSSVRAGANTPEAVAALPGHLWTWEDPWPGVTDGGAAYFQGERHPGARTPMMFHAVSRQAADEFEAAWLAGGAASGAAEAHAAPSSAPPGARSSTPSPAGGKRRRAGYLAWEAMRIAAWKPRLGRETDARAIPPEVDWLRTAVHTAKGCYRGQETIARVINLGRPPRRLTYLQLDGSRGDLPAPGTPITVGGRQVGVITSSARHADEGPIALALIARAVPVSTVFDIDGVAAAQEEIVPVHGKSSVSPESRPGADLSREAGQRGGSTGFGGLGSALGSR
ncbi:MAG: YgfZ/GcvT domain-containing protein [Pauljensenia sp.]